MECVDADAGSWIKPRLTGRWGSVTAVVPNGYDAYVRVLHPVTYGEHIVQWSDVANITERHIHPLVQWWRLVDADDPLHPVSTLWEGDPPRTGELIPPAANAIVTTMTKFTATPHATYFGFWSGYSSNNGTHTWPVAARDLQPADHRTKSRIPTPCGELKLPARTYGLVVGSLPTAPRIADYLDYHASGPTSANLMWPTDRQWFVASEIDFDSTLIACSTETARAITTHSDLEAYTVGPNDSLQSDADTINH